MPFFFPGDGLVFSHSAFIISSSSVVPGKCTNKYKTNWYSTSRPNGELWCYETIHRTPRCVNDAYGCPNTSTQMPTPTRNVQYLGVLPIYWCYLTLSQGDDYLTYYPTPSSSARLPIDIVGAAQFLGKVFTIENFCKVQIIFCTSEFTILVCNYLPKVISSGSINCKWSVKSINCRQNKGQSVSCFHFV